MWNSFFAICLCCGIASRSLVWLSKMVRCICRIWTSAMFNLRKLSSKLYDQNTFDDGIDMPICAELIANGRSTEQIAAEISADGVF